MRVISIDLLVSLLLAELGKNKKGNKIYLLGRAKAAQRHSNIQREEIQNYYIFCGWSKEKRESPSSFQKGIKMMEGQIEKRKMRKKLREKKYVF